MMMDNVIAKAELITPEYATEMLQISDNTGFKNRKINQYRINTYAQKMKKGEWTINNDMICIDKEGAVINGQNRLHAVIISGSSVPMMVLRGIDRETFSNMDGVWVRTDAHKYFTMGVPQSQSVTCGMHALISYLTKGNFSSNYIGDAVHFFPIYKKYETAFREGVSMYFSQGLKRLPVGFCVSSYVLLNSVDPISAECFFNGIVYGEDIRRGNPIFALRSSLEMLMQKNSRMRSWQTAASTFLAWNAYMKRQKRTLLRWGNKEELPEIYGFDRASFLDGLEYLFED